MLTSQAQVKVWLLSILRQTIYLWRLHWSFSMLSVWWLLQSARPVPLSYQSDNPSPTWRERTSWLSWSLNCATDKKLVVVATCPNSTPPDCISYQTPPTTWCTVCDQIGVESWNETAAKSRMGSGNRTSGSEGKQYFLRTLNFTPI